MFRVHHLEVFTRNLLLTHHLSIHKLTMIHLLICSATSRSIQRDSMARFSFELSCKLFPALAVSSSLYPTSCSFSHLVHVLSVILFHDQTGSKPSTQSPEDLHDGESWMSATPVFIGKHTFVQKLLTLGQSVPVLVSSLCGDTINTPRQSKKPFDTGVHHQHKAWTPPACRFSGWSKRLARLVSKLLGGNTFWGFAVREGRSLSPSPDKTLACTFHYRLLLWRCDRTVRKHKTAEHASYSIVRTRYHSPRFIHHHNSDTRNCSMSLSRHYFTNVFIPNTPLMMFLGKAISAAVPSRELRGSGPGQLHGRPPRSPGPAPALHSSSLIGSHNGLGWKGIKIF